MIGGAIAHGRICYLRTAELSRLVSIKDIANGAVKAGRLLLITIQWVSQAPQLGAAPGNNQAI